MKNDILIDAIGLINEETVRDAKTYQKKVVKFPFKKLIAIAAAVILCFSAVPVLAAAGVEPAYRLIYSISPSIARTLKPVEKSCVDNGIQMEVAAAYVHGDTAEIYIAMKDLEGDRIDETTDLFDSYHISTFYDSCANCSFEGYDEETGVATFLITITHMNGEEFSGDEVTFSVSRFLSHKNKLEGLIPEVDLSVVNSNPETRKDVNIRGASGFDEPTNELFLIPEENNICEPIPGVSVTAIGYVDGRLHVQLYFEDILNTDNHGSVWLEDSKGNIVMYGENEAFWDSEECGSYEEYIFDVPYDELGNYSLYGEFTTCGTLTEGDWQVTFPMSDVV